MRDNRMMGIPERARLDPLLANGEPNRFLFLTYPVIIGAGLLFLRFILT